MPGYQRISGRTSVQVAAWGFLGEETLSVDGTAATAANLPSQATIVVVSAETASIYYAINNALATVNSGGFVPANTTIVLGPLSNLNSMSFRGSAAASVHLQYFKET